MVIGGRHYSAFPAMYRRKNQVLPDTPISGPLRALEIAFKEAEVRKEEAYRRGILSDHPTLLEHGPIRLLISASPTNHDLAKYARTLQKHNVTDVVRVCEPTYHAESLRQFGFNLHELPFPDGDAPGYDVIDCWLSLLENIFRVSEYVKANPTSASLSDDSTLSDLSNISSDKSDLSNASSDKSYAPKATVAIHCAAGLGRAPVLAAIALVELGLDPFEAVGWIRALRRGAINGRQMAFVESYSRRPPPSPAKRTRMRGRSGSFVGSFWPTLKAARPFRPRSPQRNAPAQNKTLTPRRVSCGNAI